MTNRTYKLIIFLQVCLILAIASLITAGDAILSIATN